MGGLIIWLFISHGFLLAIGIAMFFEGNNLLGVLFTGILPALRVAARFRERGGYRLIGGSTPWSGNLGDRGGRALRSTEPRWFKICLTTEVAVIAALFVLFVFLPAIGK